MAGKKEFSAVVVKSFKCFCQIFPVPDSESGSYPSVVAANWRYAQRWWRWHRAGLDGRVALKGGLKRVVIRQLRMLGMVGFPIPTYDAQAGVWQMQKSSASG